NRCDSPVATPTVNTPYQVTGTKPDGCLGIGGVVVNVYPSPVPLVTATPPGPLEIGSPVALSSGLPEAYTFVWTVNGQPVDGTEANIDAVVVAEGDNVFKVVATSTAG